MRLRLAHLLRVFRRLSLLKIRNAFWLYLSYYYSKHTQRLWHKGLPMSIAIEPTTACNLRCPECPSGLRSFTRPTGMLQEQTFKKVIDELADRLINLTFYFQGEPYLHPKFTELVRYAHERNIYTSTSTNAHFLSEENAKKTIQSGLDRLIISIDGTTQATYEAYRVGGKLEKVIEGVRTLVRCREQLRATNPYIVLQFLVVRPNEHQIGEAKALVQSLGVEELSLKTAQIYDYAQGSPLMPTLDRFSRYRLQADGSYALKNDLPNACWRMWHSCVITWDGGVVPCCFDKDAAHRLGETSEQPFPIIWNSPAYQSFRKALLHSRRHIDICQNCTEGMKA